MSQSGQRLEGGRQAPLTKLSWYAAQGISVWDNNNPSGRLIVTEETKDSGFDSRAIRNLAEHLFGM